MLGHQQALMEGNSNMEEGIVNSKNHVDTSKQNLSNKTKQNKTS